MEEQDVEKVNGEWFVYFDMLDECSCGNEVKSSGWYNIDKAVKEIIKQKELEEKLSIQNESNRRSMNKK